VGESVFAIWLAPLELIGVDPAGRLVVVEPDSHRGNMARFTRPMTFAGVRLATQAERDWRARDGASRPAA
jgi:hypothetical protein